LAHLPDRPEVLLLDAGNTVVFLDEAAVAHAAAQAGVPMTPVAVRAAIRPATQAYEAYLTSGGSHAAGWDVYMRELLDRGAKGTGATAPTNDDLDRAVRAARRAHDGLNLWRRVPAELPSALHTLRTAGVRLGVVSNSEGHIAELLGHVGVADFFEVIVDSAREGVAKPDPRIFALALRRLGADPARAVYVGDVPDVDVRGARAAGLDAVLIDAFDHHPDYADAPRIRSVAELAEAWG
jgi:putative hydrolase of the HAD superfamily